RLVLAALSITVGAFRVEFAEVLELDENGRLGATILFDPSDLDDAYRELDERYLASEATAIASAWSFGARSIRAYNERDWDAYRVMLADDFVYVDHRPANLGTVEGVEPFLTRILAMTDVVPDLVLRVPEIIRSDETRFAVEIDVQGTNAGGGEVQI